MSEFHTGYRAYSREVLESIPFQHNSDDFVFDNEILIQAIYFGFRIGEVSCPARYFPEASSIDFKNSIMYGLGVLETALKYRAQKIGLLNLGMFKKRPFEQIKGYYQRLV